jgi:hypothetical protein
MSTKNTFKWIADLYKQNRAIFHIVLFTIIGLAFIYWIDYALAFETLYSWNLSYINNLTGTFGFILSIITIYLLYINYQQQRKELHSLIEQNNDMIRENQIANNQNLQASQLQVILSEKKSLDDRLRDIKENKIDYNNYFESINLLILELIGGMYLNHALIINYSKNINKWSKEFNDQLFLINHQIKVLKSVVGNNGKYSLLSSSFDMKIFQAINAVNDLNINNYNISDFTFNNVQDQDAVSETLVILKEIQAFTIEILEVLHYESK